MVLQTRLSELTGIPRDDIRVNSRAALAHQSNHLYDAWGRNQHWIVKEFIKPEEWNDSPVREYSALKRLESLDIAPQPVAFDPGNPPERMPLVIYEYMTGQMWDRVAPAPNQMAQLASLWLATHSILTDGIWYSRGYPTLTRTALFNRFQGYLQAYADWAAVHFEPGLALIPLITPFIESSRIRSNLDILKRMKPVLCFCRADPRFANVIQRPDGRLGMVDWEDSGLRDPALDLADLITHPNQEDLVSHDLWASFLDPYLEVQRRLDPEIEDRMMLFAPILLIYNLTTFLWLGVEQERKGKVRDWRINEMEPNQRLRRYLAYLQSWPNGDFTSCLEELGESQFFPIR